MIKQAALLKIDGLLCLRLAVKLNECQDTMNLCQISGDGPSVYQQLLDEVSSTVLELRDLLFNFDITTLTETDLDRYLNCLLQIRETQILIANDWKLTASDCFVAAKEHAQLNFKLASSE